MVEYFNTHNFIVHISIDGENSARDLSIVPNWDKIRKIKRVGTAITFYKENSDIHEISEYIDSLNVISNKDFLGPSNHFFNFIHSTKKTNIVSNKDLAKQYVIQICTQLEYEFIKFKRTNIFNIFLKSIFRKYVMQETMTGARCCREEEFAIDVAGNILPCSYTSESIGTIFEKIDWDKVSERYVPSKCKKCELFNICGNYCLADITELECYIMKKINKHFNKLMIKYDIPYETFKDLEGRCK